MLFSRYKPVVEDAIKRWVMEREKVLKEIRIPEDPVKAIRGMLKHVKKSGVELQHEVQQIRTGKIKY